AAGRVAFQCQEADRISGLGPDGVALHIRRFSRVISDIPVSYSPEQLDISHVAMPTSIVKRDGQTVAFDANRIKRAMRLCFQSVNAEPHVPIDELLLRVLNAICALGTTPTVERVQNIVEITL